MKVKRSILFLLIVAVAMLSIVPAVSAQDSLIESVCFVSDTGRLNDGGFNQTSYEGMERAAEDFGLESTFIETQAITDYENNIQTCLDDGYDAILTVGFLIAEATNAAAIANPDVYFIGVDQGVQDGPENYVGLQFREDQASFLVGAMAALLSESGIVAGVYGIEIPPVVKLRNGFEQGAKYINPDIQTLGVYIPDFNDPAGGGAAANSAIGEGADVIFGAGGQTGTGGIKEAATKDGVLVIGVDSDEYLSNFENGETPGAENLITSAQKNLDVAVYRAIEALVNGGEGFPGGSTIINSAADGGVGYAPPHDAADKISAEVTEQMEAILAGLKDGSIVTGVDPVSGALLDDLFTVAEANGLTTLLAAAEAAGFGDLMTSIPPGTGITVFAPTDDAFAALPEGTLDALLADPTGDLLGILSNHIVLGAFPASEIVGMSELTTAAGTVTVTVTDEGVFLNDTVQVIMTDVLFDHGVIHVIDGVLIPATE